MEESLMMISPGSLQQHISAINIRSDKFVRIHNRSINMGLRCEMNNRLGLLSQATDKRRVCNITANKPVARICLQGGKVLKVSGVGQFVQIDNGGGWVLLNKVPNKV